MTLGLRRNLLALKAMNHLRAVCRPHMVSSFVCCSKGYANEQLLQKFTFASRSPDSRSAHLISLFDSYVFFHSRRWPRNVEFFCRSGSRRNFLRSSKWDSDKSPYEILATISQLLGDVTALMALNRSSLCLTELERDADDELIKLAYRRLAKSYHPDVYDGRGTLEEGETAESRFIKIQAAYELLIDEERRREYDNEHRVNPMKASQAWMEWLMKKRKAFDQRGDMAIVAWAEQQQRELNLRARRLSHSKMDPEEEKRILAKEKKASIENLSNTLKRHTLVLKKRDLMRKKAEEEKKKVIDRLLAAEGFELANEDEDGS